MTWSVIISATASASGLKFSARDYKPPAAKIIREYPGITDPLKLLQAQFNSNVKVYEGIFDELSVFDKAWRAVYPGIESYTLAHPFFTVKGDFFVNLIPTGSTGVKDPEIPLDNPRSHRELTRPFI